MKLKYQFVVLFLASFFMRPILAEQIQMPTSASAEEKKTEAEPKVKAESDETKKHGKKPPLPDARKALRELFEKENGKPTKGVY